MGIKMPRFVQIARLLILVLLSILIGQIITKNILSSQYGERVDLCKEYEEELKTFQKDLDYPKPASKQETDLKNRYREEYCDDLLHPRGKTTLDILGLKPDYLN